MQNQPTVIREAVARPTSEFLQKEIQQINLSPEGMEYHTSITDYTIGCIIGIAQQSPDQTEKTLSFVAYYPVDKPQFLAMVVFDNIADIDLNSDDTLSCIILRFFQEMIQSVALRSNDSLSLTCVK